MERSGVLIQVEYFYWEQMTAKAREEVCQVDEYQAPFPWFSKKPRQWIAGEDRELQGVHKLTQNNMGGSINKSHTRSTDSQASAHPGLDGIAS